MTLCRILRTCILCKWIVICFQLQILTEKEIWLLLFLLFSIFSYLLLSTSWCLFNSPTFKISSHFLIQNLFAWPLCWLSNNICKHSKQLTNHWRLKVSFWSVCSFMTSAKKIKLHKTHKCIKCVYSSSLTFDKSYKLCTKWEYVQNQRRATASNLKGPLLVPYVLLTNVISQRQAETVKPRNCRLQSTCNLRF